jgi:exodeoxyribonuclease V alpha subunit
MRNIDITAETILDCFSNFEAGLIRTLARLDGGEDAAVLLAAALTSRAADQGHVCIDLSGMAGGPLEVDAPHEREITCPSLQDWLTRLKASPLVGHPAQWRPLVLDRGHFLYLQRLHHNEQAVARDLVSRALHADETLSPTDGSQRIAEYFADMQGETDQYQMAAAVVALRRRLCVISGGPGTGKTTTAAKIIGLLIDVHHPRILRFALCAPTGKAAARLGEALRAAVRELPGPAESIRMFPTEASTIHRMLDRGRHGFRYNADHPLRVDVVVVDEASMVDLTLMTHLLAAVPPDARLIILGDHHQLASVEAGAVMGDICQDVVPVRQAPDLRTAFDQLRIGADSDGRSDRAEHSALSDNVVVLRHNYRFDNHQGIGALIRAVNAGDARAVSSVMSGPAPALDWLRPPLSEADRRRLRQTVVAGYRTLFTSPTVAQALDALGHFMILAATIKGPWGAEQLVVWVENLLRRAGWIEGTGAWYPGRPVMIRRNDYRAGLFNGDVGIAWPEGPLREAAMRVWFRMPDGHMRAFLPEQLPNHQTALALTVHKSQGSEYRRIVLALPGTESPVLNRELLYTGLSRARQGILLVAGERVLDLAVNRRIERSSGLSAALVKRTPGAAGEEKPPVERQGREDEKSCD